MARLPFYLLVLSTLLLAVTADSFLARPPSSSFLPAINVHTKRTASLPASLPSCSLNILLQTRGGTAAAAALPTSALVEKKGGAAAVALEGEKTLWERSKVWVFIGLWYFFNVAFNIYNKKVRPSLLEKCCSYVFFLLLHLKTTYHSSPSLPPSLPSSFPPSPRS